MADKIVLQPVSGGYNLTAINRNFEEIADALNEKVLYRDTPQGSANELKTALDANQQRIVNLPAPIEPTEPVRKQDIQSIQDNMEASAQNLIAEARGYAELADNRATIAANAAINADTSLHDVKALALDIEQTITDASQIAADAVRTELEGIQANVQANANIVQGIVDDAAQAVIDATDGYVVDAQQAATQAQAAATAAQQAASSITSPIPISNGGTGATTVAQAKVNLGLGAVDNTSDLNKPVSTATATFVTQQIANSKKGTGLNLLPNGGFLVNRVGAPYAPEYYGTNRRTSYYNGGPINPSNTPGGMVEVVSGWDFRSNMPLHALSFSTQEQNNAGWGLEISSNGPNNDIAADAFSVFGVGLPHHIAMVPSQKFTLSGRAYRSNNYTANQLFVSMYWPSVGYTDVQIITIPSGETWADFSVTFTAPGGYFAGTALAGASLRFALQAGTNYKAPSVGGIYANALYVGNTAMPGGLGVTNNQFIRLSKLRLEEGDKASPIGYDPIELAERACSARIQKVYFDLAIDRSGTNVFPHYKAINFQTMHRPPDLVTLHTNGSPVPPVTIVFERRLVDGGLLTFNRIADVGLGSWAWEGTLDARYYLA